jgi:hypothetical protein
MTRTCCRSVRDTGGNPIFKMHACDSDDPTVTLCGLDQVTDVGVLAGYNFMCRTCFPPSREKAWTPENGNSGDEIVGEGRGD